MAMALLMRMVEGGVLTMMAGYESGHVAVFVLKDEVWETGHASQPHSQPVLGMGVHPKNAWSLSTSADALVVRHGLRDSKAGKVSNTKHSGLQQVAVRSDGKLFATAGWDGRFRVYSASTMKQLAVLMWHPVGCYSVAFAEILDEDAGEELANVGSELVRLEGMQAVALTVEEARVKRESRKHWIAGGAKDGKISLWQIY